MSDAPIEPNRVAGHGGGHIVILGLMGVGKSTTGVAVASKLHRAYVDSDRDIEQLTGRSSRDIVVSHGIADLHRLEAAVLLGALSRDAPAVITAAASVVEDELVRQALRYRAFVVRLTAPLNTTIERQAEGDHRRPMTYAELNALAARREPMFAAVENLTVTVDRDTAEVVAEITAALNL